MNRLPKYYLHEFARDRWHVCDRERDGRPVYDDAPHGKDAPIVLTDKDTANTVRDEMNEEAVRAHYQAELLEEIDRLKGLIKAFVGDLKAKDHHPDALLSLIKEARQ